MFRNRLPLLLAAALFVTSAAAGSLPYFSFWDNTNSTGMVNQLIASINSYINPGSMASYSTNRNLLDNGDMFIDQRGTAAQTAGTTTGCSAGTTYSADRWCADVNMASGAGTLQVTTSSPTPPTGFINQEALVRNSGALLQPVCALQELPFYRAENMAGQVVDFSVYAEALAGLNADNGNIANLYLITGTDSTQKSIGGRSGVTMTVTVKQSSFTISTSTGVITNASTVVAGQPITITAATIPTGITAGATYYVSSASLTSGTSFTIAPTYAQAIAGTGTVIPSTAGTTNVLNLSYITPPWTGLAVYGANNAGAGQSSAAQAYGQATSNPFTLSATSWTRIQTGPISVPVGVTEAAVAICFPPAGTGSGGTTDGLAFTGAQLEIMGPNQTTASPYEFVAPALEQQEAYRFYYQINDQAAHTVLPLIGNGQDSTHCILTAIFPAAMDAVPTYASVGTIASTTFKVLTGTTETTLSAMAQPSTNWTANSVNAGAVAATTTGQTAAASCFLTGQSAQAIGVSWTADF